MQEIYPCKHANIIKYKKCNTIQNHSRRHAHKISKTMGRTIFALNSSPLVLLLSVYRKLNFEFITRFTLCFRYHYSPPPPFHRRRVNIGDDEGEEQEDEDEDGDGEEMEEEEEEEVEEEERRRYRGREEEVGMRRRREEQEEEEVSAMFHRDTLLARL